MHALTLYWGGANGVCGSRGSNLATYSLTTTDMDTHSSEAKKKKAGKKKNL